MWPSFSQSAFQGYFQHFHKFFYMPVISSVWKGNMMHQSIQNVNTYCIIFHLMTKSVSLDTFLTDFCITVVRVKASNFWATAAQPLLWTIFVHMTRTQCLISRHTFGLVRFSPCRCFSSVRMLKFFWTSWWFCTTAFWFVSRIPGPGVEPCLCPSSLLFPFSYEAWRSQTIFRPKHNQKYTQLMIMDWKIKYHKSEWCSML